MEPLLRARHGAANEGTACGSDWLASQRRQIGLTTFLMRVLSVLAGVGGDSAVGCGLWAVGCGLCVDWSSVLSDSRRCLSAVFDGRPGLLLLDRLDRETGPDRLAQSQDSKMMEPRAVGLICALILRFRSGPLVGDWTRYGGYGGSC